MITNHVVHISIPVTISLDDEHAPCSFEHKQSEARAMAVLLQKNILDNMDSIPIELFVKYINPYLKDEQ